MKQFSLLLFSFFLSSFLFGQQFLDDFTRADNVSVGGSWVEASTDATEDATLVSNQLEISSGGTSGRDYVHQDVSALFETTYDNAASVLIWEFNMRSSRSSPSGFGSGNYGMAFVLGSDNNDITLGNGYAVVLGNTGSPDNIRLISYTNGLDLNSGLTDIITGSDYTTDHLSVRVIFVPSSGTWSLYVRDDGTSFADPSTITNADLEGSMVNTTHTAIDLPNIMCLYNHGIAASDKAEFDNINVPLECTAPTTQATTFATANATSNSLDISFMRGNGDGGVIVLAKEGSAVDTDPISGSSYNADATFSSGDQIGTGNYVIYNSNAIANLANTGNITISGLTSGETYHFAVYEYTNADDCYLIPALTGNETTPCTTPSDISNLAGTIENAQSVISWDLPSCYDEVLVVAKSGSSVTSTPSNDGSAYSANADFGNGTDLGSSEFVVYKGNGTTETVTGLTNGTQYFLKVFTRKGTSWNTGIEIDVTPDNEVCEAFDDGISPLATGWSPVGVGEYATGNTSAKSIKFDGSGDKLLSPATTNAVAISFYIKGNSVSGTYSFLVEGFDGSDFITIDNITSITGSYVQKSYTGLPNYEGFRFHYVTKDNGNIAVDDICISADLISTTALPVELLVFNGTRTTEGVQLTWETATEINNDHFMVQRSSNGKTFENIGKVTGFGTTTEIQSYDFMDTSPANGLNYYRLKQVDFDEKFEFSDIITVEIEKQLTSVDVYPNPSTGRYNIQLSDNWTNQVTLEVLDMTGRLVHSKNIENNISELNLEHLSNGNYFLRFTNQNDVLTTRIVKMK